MAYVAIQVMFEDGFDWAAGGECYQCYQEPSGGTGVSSIVAAQ